MSNVFNQLPVYAAKWNVTSRRNFTQEEIAAVSSASVVDSDYGQSVCFVLVSGGQTYIPLSNTSSLATGSIVDLSHAELLTLSRSGDSDILRVDA